MTTDAYAIAEAGGKHKGLLKRYLNDPAHLLERAIRSYGQRIEEHRAWIKNPFLKVESDIDPRQLADLIEVKWPKDIIRLVQERDVLIGILEERRNGGTN